ncbi:MAG: glucose 1-dehydrogenase [Chloroflexi bacterium]|nr:glucose 1-dehydrogenase [Chloroflexota bacterium]
MMQRLAGKVAIVTGAARGIGRQIGRTFAAEGAMVVVCDVIDSGGRETVEMISAAGGQATYLPADVTSIDDWQHAVERAATAYGDLHILVNNAAKWRGGTAVDTPWDVWAMTRGTILDAAYLGCQQCIPTMIESGGGSIISISSVHGLLAARRSAAYEAAKGGLILLMKQVACDFGPQGIRANCICPGLIVSPEKKAEHEAHPEHDRFNAEVYPVRRYGTAQDIAWAAVFLASDESTFVSGQALAVDGGLTAQLQDDVAYRTADYVRTQQQGVQP